MSRFVFHGRKQPSSRSNLVHRNSFIKSGLKSNTSCTFVLICKKVVVYMVYEHYWSHLFNLCSSFNDKSTLLDPGIGVLLAQPHTGNGTKHSLSIQTNSRFKQFTLKTCLHPVLWGPVRAPGLHSRAVRRAFSWSLDALWNTERKPWQADKCPNQPRAPL